ncbi:alpha/beta hydrolase [Actinoplanes sp. NPDC051859]|uniref:alpha/beta hydrolase n=1 Tax=Actinoplanes sp. NPDC051859 TaxID=3363909 RepID=UPI0037882088
MEPSAGAWCTASEVGFRLRDHDHRLSSVRLDASVVRGDFTYRDDLRSWELRLPRPRIHRLEYRLTLGHAGGGTETIADPDNPHRLGDASVLSCPDYDEPTWLHLPRAEGQWRDVYLPLSAVRGEMVARIWSPTTPTDRVVVAHDGPDYDRYGELSRYTAAMIGAGRLPPYHLVLLPPGERLEWYSASPAYARALAADVLPRIAAELGTTRPMVGVGASLGALAMLHAQRRHPDRFGGLLLQSGSFFRPHLDRQESGFRRYLRIVRFTGRVVRSADGPGVPVALTCGTVEENLANNKEMARALRDHGYAVTFAEVPDAHNWTAWRDALDPYLTALLLKVFH